MAHQIKIYWDAGRKVGAVKVTDKKSLPNKLEIETGLSISEPRMAKLGAAIEAWEQAIVDTNDCQYPAGATAQQVKEIDGKYYGAHDAMTIAAKEAAANARKA